MECYEKTLPNCRLINTTEQLRYYVSTYRTAIIPIHKAICEQYGLHAGTFLTAGLV